MREHSAQTRERCLNVASAPLAVHSTSRSGGLSDITNQRAVSAPKDWMKGNQVPETTSSATDVLKAGNRVVALGIAAIVAILLGAAVLHASMLDRAESLFKELLERTEDIELAGPPAWVEANFVSGLKRLPIRFTARKKTPAN